MKKTNIVSRCAVLFAFCLSACAGLSGAADEDLSGKIGGVIALLEAAVMRAVYAMLRADVAAGLSPHSLKKVFASLETLGARRRRAREIPDKPRKEGTSVYFAADVLYADGERRTHRL
jgi:hypothetical protein